MWLTWIKAEDENAIWGVLDNVVRKEMETHKRGGVESAFDEPWTCSTEKTLPSIMELLRGTSSVNLSSMKKIVRIFTEAAHEKRRGQRPSTLVTVGG